MKSKSDNNYSVSVLKESSTGVLSKLVTYFTE